MSGGRIYKLHDRFRELSRQRSFRWGATLILLGLLGACSVHATRTWFRPPWSMAANGMDDRGNVVVDRPSNIFEECRNIALVWPGLTELLLAFVTLLLSLILVANEIWRRWAEGHEPGLGSFALLGGMGLALGAIGGLAFLLFCALGGP